MYKRQEQQQHQHAHIAHQRHGDVLHQAGLLGENGLSLNLYTILFIAFFGIGYGAYYARCV